MIEKIGYVQNINLGLYGFRQACPESRIYKISIYLALLGEELDKQYVLLFYIVDYTTGS